MSVLGRSQIIERIRDSSLVVTPIMTSDQIGAASIDLRMGNVVLMVRGRKASHVDPKSLKQANNDPHDREFESRQKHERYEVPFKMPFLLHPGSLALVPTLEWIKLPADLLGTVTARSTWAREGLSIATATLIEPSYIGIVTLELSNLGGIPMALYPGLPIAQIAFATVSGETSRPTKGQFDLSFEPRQGRIAKDEDFHFLP